MASSKLPWIFQILSRLPRTHTCRKRDSRFSSMRLVWRLSSRIANLFTFSYFRQSDDELLIRSVVALVHKPVGCQCLNREKPPTFTKTFPKNDDNSQDTGLRRDSLSQQFCDFGSTWHWGLKLSPRRRQRRFQDLPQGSNNSSSSPRRSYLIT